MKNKWILFFFLNFSSVLFSQSEICFFYKSEFSKLIKDGNLKEALSVYNNLIYVCGEKEIQPQMNDQLLKLAENKKVLLTETYDGTFHYFFKSGTENAFYAKSFFAGDTSLLAEVPALKKHYQKYADFLAALHLKGFDNEYIEVFEEHGLICVRNKEEVRYLVDYKMNKVINEPFVSFLPLTNDLIFCVTVTDNEVATLYSFSQRKFITPVTSPAIQILQTGEFTGLASYLSENKKYKICDFSGKVHLEELDTVIFYPEERKIVIRTNQGFRLLNPQLKPQIDFSKEIIPLNMGAKLFWYAKQSDNIKTVYDNNCHPVISSPQFTDIIPAKENYVAAAKGGKYGILELDTQKEVIPFEYLDVIFITETVFALRTPKYWEFVDEQYNEIGGIDNLKIRPLNAEGKIYIQSEEKGKIAVYDLTGKKILQPLYDSVSYDHSMKRFTVVQNGKESFVEVE